MEVKVVTWIKDSHGLFDYESKNIEIKKFEVENSSFILRNGKITAFDKNYFQIK